MPGVYLVDEYGKPITNINRLPVGLEVESITAGNIVLVDGDDDTKKVSVLNSALAVALTGSIAVLIKEYLSQNQHIGLTNHIRAYGANITTGSGSVLPLDVSKFGKRAVYVRNGYNQEVTISIALHKSLASGIEPNRVIILNNESLAAGAGKLWDLSNLASINSPLIGLSVTVISSSTQEPTTGTIDVIMYGGAA